jgi:hypothetical protein
MGLGFLMARRTYVQRLSDGQLGPRVLPANKRHPSPHSCSTQLLEEELPGGEGRPRVAAKTCTSGAPARPGSTPLTGARGLRGGRRGRGSLPHPTPSPLCTAFLCAGTEVGCGGQVLISIASEDLAMHDNDCRMMPPRDCAMHDNDCRMRPPSVVLYECDLNVFKRPESEPACQRGAQKSGLGPLSIPHASAYLRLP